MPEISLNLVATIRSCYSSKFGIPRQPGLVNSATATLELLPPYNQEEALRGIQDFSHLWILFVFHQSVQEEFKATVRPPRLGGNERLGVFATRSNFRPNPIGLSVVKLLEVEGTTLKLGGGDFLDDTPVLDIKPYIPYVDCVSSASSAFANQAPPPLYSVSFSPQVESALTELENETRPNLKQLIYDMLRYNPRPAYQNDAPDRIFGTTVFDLDVKWKQDGNNVTVIQIRPI